MHVISMKATLLLLIVPPYQLGLSLKGKNYFLYEKTSFRSSCVIQSCQREIKTVGSLFRNKKKLNKQINKQKLQEKGKHGVYMHLKWSSPQSMHRFFFLYFLFFSY